jgi:hypothetical protein
MKPFLRNSGGVGTAVAAKYAEPALPPASPWLGDKPPSAPVAIWKKGIVSFADDADRRYVLVASRTAKGWKTRILPGRKTEVSLENPGATTNLAVAAVDRVGTQSEWRFLTPSQ